MNSTWLNTQNRQLGVNNLVISRKRAQYEHLEWNSRYFELLQLHTNTCDGNWECYLCILSCIQIYISDSCDIICHSFLSLFFSLCARMQCTFHKRVPLSNTAFQLLKLIWGWLAFGLSGSLLEDVLAVVLHSNVFIRLLQIYFLLTTIVAEYFQYSKHRLLEKSWTYSQSPTQLIITVRLI